MNIELRNKLVDVFAKTASAHHAAFAATDGVDPEWPIWYAENLLEPLGNALGVAFTKSQLVYCVMNADFERAARAPDSDWAEFYADHFIERFSQTPTPAEDKLVLYRSKTCPFCALVTSAIDTLGLDVELREVFEEPRYRDELVEARGRATVPVLRIISPDGEERWMPESRDIIAYLKSLS